MIDDPFDLDRFVAGQADGVYEAALSELRSGAKRTHWMWFVFPQHRHLGRSPTAKHYGLSGIKEARAYASHPVLGPRLRECAAAALPHVRTQGAVAVMGPVDALKLASSMEIFIEAGADEGGVFTALLEAARAWR